MKTNKIIYWTSTSLISAGFLLSGVMYLSGNVSISENFSRIGLPHYLLYIIGTAKLLGSIAVFNPWYPNLKEWAYAGFTFTLVGAVWTHIVTGTPFIAPLMFLVLTFLSYYFSKRIMVLKTA